MQGSLRSLRLGVWAGCCLAGLFCVFVSLCVCVFDWLFVISVTVCLFAGLVVCVYLCFVVFGTSCDTVWRLTITLGGLLVSF